MFWKAWKSASEPCLCCAARLSASFFHWVEYVFCVFPVYWNSPGLALLRCVKESALGTLALDAVVGVSVPTVEIVFESGNIAGAAFAGFASAADAISAAVRVCVLSCVSVCVCVCDVF